ncbi:MAG: helix-turn-helix domain-containing protein [Leptospiraceae bacterium]|nr:helix-turn-helix domain-containing protein [Leptospiraceae bacterium]
MRPYTHLSKQDRLCIEQKLQEGYSLSQIARMLNRHPSTISREVRRNKLVRHYSARHAHEEARARRKNANASKFSEVLWSEISHALAERLSPEQIAGRMRLEGYKGVCTQTIYNYIRRKSGISLNGIRGFFWLPSWSAKR